MKLFESSWRDGFSFYERYYDTQLKKSIKKQIDLPYEWYEPLSTGIYTSILDETIRLDKKQGNSKDGKDQYGFLDPMYRNIRDNYWNKDAYNLKPNIWYLDIETRVSTCSTGFPVPEKAAEPISLMQFFDTNTDVMYVLGTRDSESDPKIKVMGLEIIKSNTPKGSQKKLKEAIPHILDKDEVDLRNWVKEIKQDFRKANLNDIASVGGVSRIDYNLNDKGVPIGSRAAIVHNTYIKNNHLEDKYAPIQAGDKCKRLFLTTPNMFSSEIVAFTNELFTKELECCIDYDTNFEKNFLKPLYLMVEPLNYDLEKETESLDDW